jgi:Uma2 family endonuclease
MAVATTASTMDGLRPHRFTIDQLEGMVRKGILPESERVELIEGQIVDLRPKGIRHIWTVSRLCRVFNRRDDVVFTPQSTLQLDEHTGPEPDIAVFPAGTSEARRPSAGDAILVIEVADSSLAYDRQTKAPLYARFSIPEYWIVDLNNDRIEVYREPSPIGYRSVRPYPRGERLSPAFASDLIVEVDAILGQPEPPATDDPERPSRSVD